MGWEKKGLIFETKGQHPWMVSHACVPTVLPINDGKWRIYFAPRNASGQSIPTFIDVDAENPSKVLYLHDQPIMPLGKRGTFDDGGIMPCCVVPHEGKLYLYYVGWNPSVSVDYRNAIGFAVSEDGGQSFQRLFDGALIDRNRQEPYFTASPWVMKEGNTWHMWYASSTGFKTVRGKPEPLYVIKYASSTNGMDWKRENHTAIHPLREDEANARATVIKENGRYKMWFAWRGSMDFRDGKDAYRIGYAESDNALDWKRKDEAAGITYAEKGWDSTMQTYPCVIQHKGHKYLFYNGNGFGKTGIGLAVWK